MADHSEAERRLRDAMYRAGLAPVLKPYEEGYELDFAIVTEGIRLDIEVDGAHHIDARGQQRRRDVARDRVLTSMGWTVLRYPDWRCRGAPDEVARDIADRIDHPVP